MWITFVDVNVVVAVALDAGCVVGNAVQVVHAVPAAEIVLRSLGVFAGCVCVRVLRLGPMTIGPAERPESS
eukprot:3528160-Pyramimonas_sp.AAC.1